MPKMLVRDKKPVSLHAGKEPSRRTIEDLLSAGVINLDKPQGPTSHQVTAWVRDILKVEKIGHGGTLDPKVSGVLPIATGRAVKALSLVTKSDKEYIALMRIHRDVSEEKLRTVIKTFVGRIYQTPPVRAAVKRQMRIRTVHYIDILEIRGRDVLMRVGCDAGTYIRVLCVDIGDAMGAGAHMEDLRRTRSGTMTEEDAVTLQDLTDAFHFWKEEGDEKWLRAMLLPIEVLFEPLPKIVLKDSAVDAICHGADLAVVGIVKVDESIAKDVLVAMFSEKEEAVAVGTSKMTAQEMIKEKEGVAASTDRVFMPPGTYPRMW